MLLYYYKKLLNKILDQQIDEAIILHSRMNVKKYIKR
jgi:hypothetical protein